MVAGTQGLEAKAAGGIVTSCPGEDRLIHRHHEWPSNTTIAMFDSPKNKAPEEPGLRSKDL